MAVPKKRKSHSATRMQRSHDHLNPSFGVTCPQCRDTMVRHQVCKCGFYRGRQVIEVKQQEG